VRWLVPVGERRWPSVVFGPLGAAVGAVLLLGGWTSAAALAVLVPVGLALLALTRATWAGLLGAIAVLAAGVFLVTRPDVSLRTVALVTGLALILGGLSVLVPRPSRLIGALAVLAGVLLLVRPSFTAFGAGTFLVLAGLVAATRGRWLRAAAAAATAVLLAAGLALQATQPHPDSFYAAPAHRPAAHGVLLRSAPFTSDLPAGARAWRILYTTTRGDSTPTVGSAIVVAATNPPAGPRPVVVWAHGATGTAPDCAPSLGSDPVGTNSVPDIAPALAAGWVVIAPDYPGLGTTGPHPFLIGQGEARSLLDAVLAAHGLATLTLAARTLVWGHSQGGNAALWSGIIAPAYAPAAGLAGVAALAPGTGLPALAELWGDEIYAAYLIEAYSETYPDVRFDDYVRAAARVPVREQAGRCLADRKIYLSGLSTLLRGRSIWSAGPDTGALGDRLRQNVPAQPIAVPVLLAQGDRDRTVPVTIQNAYVRQECATGTRVDYRVYPGRDHVGIFDGSSPLVPELMQWSQDRLNGVPARSTC
jgi:alpha-beta hydrolase superfamily lysophospholipase